ncbi:hypothetical protein MMC10_005522 [Thelotrema lepadinum]|nr:hypothetical protein [Thelotrema lepadinum]
MHAVPLVQWELAEVKSPNIPYPISVIAAKDIPYIPNGNRLQSLSIYLLKTPTTTNLINHAVTSLPPPDPNSSVPNWHVHIHGGAWRDPNLTSASIEAAVAHAFSESNPSHPITAIASINYTLSPYPTHPSLPYDSIKNNHSDPSREAIHPAHVHDVLDGFALLRSLGLTDGSYILSGHSCGACLAFQSALQPSSYWEVGRDVPDPPRPAALLGLNGLYDLKDLVEGLGISHEHLKDVYDEFLSISFGKDRGKWPLASPARFDAKDVEERVRTGKAPDLVVLDQSTEDQLVPINQTERLESQLGHVSGLRAVRGNRCTGSHAAPWEEGIIIWESVKDILGLLEAR